ncbi:MAG: UvrD-helicase domain-containing protein [Clostridia bacterium]|nr:UvrD-helicase domain-containing protein [Clostridia bacterium]
MEEFTYRSNSKLIVLSSNSIVYKTARFIYSTSLYLNIDNFISKISDSILINYEKFTNLPQNMMYTASVENGEYTITFTLNRKQLNSQLEDSDIIFCDFQSLNTATRKNDPQLNNFLKEHQYFDILFSCSKNNINATDYLKLYTLSFDDGVNFPLLTKTQKEIVESEDKNILVQGVAGSGKTNVCVDRIIFSACRNYYGKTLYSTFSRGLLVETKEKIDSFRYRLFEFQKSFEEGNAIFLTKNKRKAVENKLGIYFYSDDDDDILLKVKQVIKYLDEKIDYFLISDMYKKFTNNDFKFADENIFKDEYINNNPKFRMSGALDKVKHLSLEIIYKEIFGMILGKYNEKNLDIMTKEEYIQQRSNSFSKIECENIYAIAIDYLKFLESKNYIDSNIASRKIIEKLSSKKEYSIAVIDEVQDFTEINLKLLSMLTIKMFCVGDALQMINPAFFSFAYLKRLMYTDEDTVICELKNNYRNSERIERIVDSLSKLNRTRFGTHSFVIEGTSIKTTLDTKVIYTLSNNFTNLIKGVEYNNITLICSTDKKKQELRKTFGKNEILTVSEAKGLERDTVVLIDILSDNNDKWDYLQKININRKTADENSVYRYYFNLFYVGVSRARQNLFVSEHIKNPLFNELINKNFEVLSSNEAANRLKEIAVTIEIDDEELVNRIAKFIELGQYQNARFAADRLSDDAIRIPELHRININEQYIKDGKYREAGAQYWKLGMLQDAKKMFRISNDTILCDLIESASSENGFLTAEIVKYFPLFAENNPVVTDLICSAVIDEASTFTKNIKQISNELKHKGGKNG